MNALQLHYAARPVFSLRAPWGSYTRAMTKWKQKLARLEGRSRANRSPKAKLIAD